MMKVSGVFILLWLNKNVVMDLSVVFSMQLTSLNNTTFNLFSAWSIVSLLVICWKEPFPIVLTKQPSGKFFEKPGIKIFVLVVVLI